MIGLCYILLVYEGQEQQSTCIDWPVFHSGLIDGYGKVRRSMYEIQKEMIRMGAWKNHAWGWLKEVTLYECIGHV
jgi:hypothetical protein